MVCYGIFWSGQFVEGKILCLVKPAILYDLLPPLNNPPPPPNPATTWHLQVQSKLHVLPPLASNHLAKESI